MKILTEVEQMKIRVEQLWKDILFQEQQIADLEEKRRKYDNKWFKEEWKVRYMDDVLTDMRTVCNSLREYRTQISERINSMQPR